jgi:hypothetical protein
MANLNGRYNAWSASWKCQTGVEGLVREMVVNDCRALGVEIAATA